MGIANPTLTRNSTSDRCTETWVQRYISGKSGILTVKSTWMIVNSNTRLMKTLLWCWNKLFFQIILLWTIRYIFLVLKFQNANDAHCNCVNSYPTTMHTGLSIEIICTVEPRYNKRPRDRQNCSLCRRTLLDTGLLYRGSTVFAGRGEYCRSYQW